jgi:hypothetical protein
MMRSLSTITLFSLTTMLPVAASAGDADYDPPFPPRILAVPVQARSFYVEFRARDDGTFGHSYVALGAAGSEGTQQTAVVGFMPKSVDDDRWSKFGIPVTGMVGVTKSDLLRRPVVRFRVGVDRATYFRLLIRIRSLRYSWTTYELVARNCNNFLGEIAGSAGLSTPIVAAQYPVHYVAELRWLNSRLAR